MLLLICAVHSLMLASPNGLLPPHAALRSPGRLSVVPEASATRADGRAGVLARVKSLWSRCDEQVCKVRRVEPLAWLRSRFPKKRPLHKLQFCEGGTHKVRRVNGIRELYVVPSRQESDSCDLGTAMNML
ncbi:hypothetical protein AB1Y20_013762 [Prymnesium parvum]|uniref:Secreted protein n=1 Tax=Prymnesium parvum TaxID=97485 RepID=A0AB34IHD8_PRYPA